MGYAQKRYSPVNSYSLLHDHSILCFLRSTNQLLNRKLEGQEARRAPSLGQDEVFGVDHTHSRYHRLLILDGRSFPFDLLNFNTCFLFDPYDDLW